MVLPISIRRSLPVVSGREGSSMVASAGSRTSATTVTRSSTTSQPTAIRPFMDSSTPCRSSALISTTVLAQDRDTPKTMAAGNAQPQAVATAMPMRVAMLIWTMAPGMAIFLTRNRSVIEKCNPTPNISNMTPISESWAAMCISPTKPGVAGLMAMPASR